MKLKLTGGGSNAGAGIQCFNMRKKENLGNLDSQLCVNWLSVAWRQNTIVNELLASLPAASDYGLLPFRYELDNS